MRFFSQITSAVLVTALPLITDAQPPVPPPPQIQIRPGLNTKTFQSRTIRVNGQEQREISVTENGDSITINHADGKEITVRRTRTVNGEKKSEEFKAPDLDTLKKQHPDAAELYRVYAEGANDKNQIKAQVQIQMGPRGNPGDPFGVPRANRSLRGQGTRQITSTLKGKTVEIKDRYGEQIEITITDKRSSDAKTRTVEAGNLADLETKDAEAAGLYKRLTAEN